MRKEYTLDRIEGDIAVCIFRQDGVIEEFSATPILEAGVPEGGIFAADISENEIISIEYLAQKTEKVRGEARRRLSALFNRREENEE